MRNVSGKLSAVLKELMRLPGMNQRLAKKFCVVLLQNDTLLHDLIFSLQQMRDCIKKCTNCGLYTESEECLICLNPARNKQYLCIVSDMLNYMSIERSKAFNGVYHVLNGVISHVDQIGPAQLNFKKLTERIQEEGITDILIGLSPTAEGQTTTLYIKQLLNNMNVRITCLTVGVSIGSDIEYVDANTIAAAIKGNH